MARPYLGRGWSGPIGVCASNGVHRPRVNFMFPLDNTTHSVLSTSRRNLLYSSFVRARSTRAGSPRWRGAKAALFWLIGPLIVNRGVLLSGACLDGTIGRQQPRVNPLNDASFFKGCRPLGSGEGVGGNRKVLFLVFLGKNSGRR